VEPVRRRIEEARETWGGLTIAGDELTAALVHEVEASDDPAGALAGMRVDDLVLAHACARGDARALEIFDARFLSRVPEFLARHAARHAADEVRQRLRERLLLPRAGAAPRVRRHAGRGTHDPQAALLRRRRRGAARPHPRRVARHRGPPPDRGAPAPRGGGPWTSSRSGRRRRRRSSAACCARW
jgi:hypothetical protein